MEAVQKAHLPAYLLAAATAVHGRVCTIHPPAATFQKDAMAALASGTVFCNKYFIHVLRYTRYENTGNVSSGRPVPARAVLAEQGFSQIGADKGADGRRFWFQG
jgi:hypothetical protein